MRSTACATALQRLALVLSLGVALVACTSRTAPTAAITSDPHSSADARVRAASLANAMRLPKGMRWTDALTQDRPDEADYSRTIVLVRHASSSKANAASDQAAQTRRLPGLVLGTINPIMSGAYDVDYVTKAPTNTTADLDYTRTGSSASAQLTVSVGWTPLRTDDMTVPITTAAATIEVWPATFGLDPLPTFSHQVDQVSGPAVGQLARYLDNLPPEGPRQPGGGACTAPLFYGSAPQITFHTPGHVVVFQYVNSCQEFTVTVDGEQRPTLTLDDDFDPTKLVMTTLLHLVP